MNRLETKIGKSVFRNPVFCASGCFGYIYNMARYTKLERIGAAAAKSITKNPREGNPPPRIWEFVGGHVGSVGQHNPGLDYFIKEIIPKIKTAVQPDQILISIGGSTEEEYLESTSRLITAVGEDWLAAIEINASCPNATSGGMSFSKNPDTLYRLACEIRKIVKGTLLVKIITGFDNYVEAAAAAAAAGADAICTSTVLSGLPIDVKRRKPAFSAIRGAAGGPAFLPINVLKTWEIYKKVSIPVIAGGGVYDLDGLLQCIMAGATAVSIGRIIFADPERPVKIVEDLEKYLVDNDISNYTELIGVAHSQD